METTTPLVYCSHSNHGPTLSASRPDAVPTQSIRLQYLNEGNANVVFRIIPSIDRQPLPDFLQGRLLRLRKDKSFIRPVQEQYAAFHDQFVPLFHARNLVEQDLVRIGPGLADVLNKFLRQLEISGVRLQSRHADTLATNEPYGFLTTDMTARGEQFQLELKPKWLLQSPDAPEDAVRCRTCALRARRKMLKSIHAATFNSAEYCPLGLLSHDALERRRVFQAVAHKNKHLPKEAGKS